jgi:hypothetical protein
MGKYEDLLALKDKLDRGELAPDEYEVQKRVLLSVAEKTFSQQELSSPNNSKSDSFTTSDEVGKNESLMLEGNTSKNNNLASKLKRILIIAAIVVVVVVGVYFLLNSSGNKNLDLTKAYDSTTETESYITQEIINNGSTVRITIDLKQNMDNFSNAVIKTIENGKQNLIGNPFSWMYDNYTDGMVKDQIDNEKERFEKVAETYLNDFMTSLGSDTFHADDIIQNVNYKRNDIFNIRNDKGKVISKVGVEWEQSNDMLIVTIRGTQSEIKAEDVDVKDGTSA